MDVCNVFVAMGTQWEFGMAGPTGLQYASLPVVLRLLNIERKKWPSIFDDIRVMEAAALDKMHEKK